MTDYYTQGWNALKRFEQEFCSVIASDVKVPIWSRSQQGDSQLVRGPEFHLDDLGFEMVYNHSYLSIPQYDGPPHRQNFKEGDKLHLVHQRLEAPGKGRVKWALRSFHSILELKEEYYVPKYRYVEEVKFVVNPTVDGYRFQILRTQGGKTRVHWGYDFNLQLMRKEFCHPQLLAAALNVIDQYMIPHEIHKVLQWFDNSVDSVRSQQLRLGGPGWSRILTGKTGAKDILNGIYDPKGIRRIPKNAFGGVGEIRTLSHLAKAVFVTRALRSLDPHTFGEVSGILLERGFYQYAGSFEHADKIDWLVSRTPKLITIKNIEECYGAISYVGDMVTMLKSMSRALRSACLTEIRRNANQGVQWAHDYVVAEHAKVETENKEIDVSELSKFEGTVNNDIVCVVPKCTHDLVQWGADYNICIGSYAEGVYRGDTFCMGFQNPQTKTFYGFAEVSPSFRRLTQLLGKYNQKLPDAEKLAIERYLVALGVNVDNYWGK